MYIRPLPFTYMGLFYVLTIKGLFYVHETPILHCLSYVSRPLQSVYYMGLSYVLCSSDLQELYMHAPPIYT